MLKFWNITQQTHNVIITSKRHRDVVLWRTFFQWDHMAYYYRGWVWNVGICSLLCDRAQNMLGQVCLKYRVTRLDDKNGRLIFCYIYHAEPRDEELWGFLWVCNLRSDPSMRPEAFVQHQYRLFSQPVQTCKTFKKVLNLKYVMYGCQCVSICMDVCVCIRVIKKGCVGNHDRRVSWAINVTTIIGLLEGLYHTRGQQVWVHAVYFDKILN